jgi:hypothetical protein
MDHNLINAAKLSLAPPKFSPARRNDDCGFQFLDWSRTASKFEVLARQQQARYGAMSWRLYESDGTGQWQHVPKSTSLAEAARYIIDREALSVRRLVFDAHVYADGGSDEDTLEQLEFSGNRACYVARRATK